MASVASVASVRYIIAVDARRRMRSGRTAGDDRRNLLDERGSMPGRALVASFVSFFLSSP